VFRQTGFRLQFDPSIVLLDWWVLAGTASVLGVRS